MAGNLQLVTVGTSTAVAIKATVVGANIQIQEDQATVGFPTNQFIVYRVKPDGTATSVGRTLAPGSQYDVFHGFSIQQPASPGQTVCYLKALVASINFIIDESGA